jgi:two-component system response regulator MprA
MTRSAARVLLAERDLHARLLQASFLEELGLAVEFASDGISTLEMAVRLQPDLVITELLLPRLDGLALCKRIKASAVLRHIPVLVVSILAASSRARDAGADAFLLKPLSQPRLAKEVGRLIELPRLERATSE